MRPMKIFYWVMGVLIAGTFVPSVLFFVLYLFGGNPEHGGQGPGIGGGGRIRRSNFARSGGRFAKNLQEFTGG